MSEFLKNSQLLTACVILDNQNLVKRFFRFLKNVMNTPRNVSSFHNVVLMIQDLFFSDGYSVVVKGIKGYAFKLSQRVNSIETRH